jgi:acetyl-CoA synthetase/medium-chain acyl-CoA synthetase
VLGFPVTGAPQHFNFSLHVIERWERLRPESCALWWTDETGARENRISFRQLGHELRQAANFFASLGIRRGDRVLLMLPRIPQWWSTMLGLIRLGAVPIPCTTLLTSKDIQFRIAAAEVHAIITDAEGAAKIENFNGLIIRADERAWRDAPATFDAQLTRSDEPGIVYFTSATTGPPKMVLHTQASYGLGHEITGKLWLDLKPTDIHWCITDTGWAKAAWSCVFGPWHAGACVFAVDWRGKFNPNAALEVLARFPITTWCAPPTALRLMVRERIPPMKSLRHCASAGEPLNPEVIEIWKRATGLTIHEGYGQTETVCLIANLPGMKIRPGSMGKPMPGFDIRLLDPDLRETDEGEIAVRVKPTRPLGLFREYWRNPDENARRFRGDWYLTGDTARRDADGYYWFIGRADDLIKSAAYRIGPFEVESALLEHPAVLEAAVVGKPDPIRGQIVKAFVVLRPGFTVTAEELIEHCKKVTAAYKHPREIEFLPELPKTVSGKIRRVELRQRA